MSNQREPFEQQFADHYQAYLEDGVGAVGASDVHRMVESSRRPARRVRPVLFAAGTVIVASAGTLFALQAFRERPPAAVTSPAATGPLAPSATASTPPSTVASPTPSPTPMPTHWELQAVSLPPPHEPGTVLATSVDGHQVAFLDEPTGKQLFLLKDGQVTELTWPGQAPDLVPNAAFSRDGSWLLIWQGGNLWRMDLVARTAVRMPDPPEGPGNVGWFGFTSDGQLVVSVSTAPNGADAHLYRMSAPTDSFAPYGHQDGIVYFFATQDGGVAGVADRRDGSPIQIFAIASSGATTLLTRIAGADFAAVSPDGKHVAYTKDAGRGGAFLLDASTGRTLALPDSTVVGFAPDAAAVALRPLSEASTLAVDMSGQTVKRVDAVLTAWVASP